MAIFEVIPDYERTEHAGASGMYQIMQLKKNGKDVTSQIDQGMMFHEEDINDLTRYLAKTFGIKENEVKYKNNDPEDHPDWPFK